MKRCDSPYNFSLSIILAILLCIFLSSCAHSPLIAPYMISAMTPSSVPASTATKIKNREILNYQDIENLVRAKIPTSTVIAYLQSTEKTYQLSPSQLQSLKYLGASSQLMNYLMESTGFYTHSISSPPSFSEQWKEFWSKNWKRPSKSKIQSSHSNDWMDPAFEESLHSPFFLR